MSSLRIVIIAGGEIRDPAFYKKLVCKDDYIICVNGGSVHAIEMGLIPDLLIGDLDSLASETRDRVLGQKPELLRHPTKKDKSDLELALDHAVGMDPVEVIIFGALGGARFDHFFINLLLLQIPLRHKVKAKIVDERHEIFLTDSNLVINGRKGDYLSLFALTSEVQGIVTEGLKYRLHNESLSFSSTRGLSNEMLGRRAEVSFDSGLLLVIKAAPDYEN